ncbi:helix-turn-helix transcriptional regulator [Legionella lytica]|uniref:helix-turn-helix transcriptional regulator n=1 Tax=Legionella lytica TaxID=96232 RepID=UPI00208EF1E5|nr:helix-turn-helix domain-containing protein [Legionella lytica]
MSINTPSRLHLLNEFESAPNSALFNQNTVAAVLSCSTQLLERNRWSGIGVPYIKMGRKVLYRKSEVLDFLQRQITYCTSSDQDQSLALVNN